MSKHRLFSCIDEPMVKIMLDMSKEHHTPAETEEIKKKFSSVDKDKFLQLCEEHELEGIVGDYALELGLEIGNDWKNRLKTVGEHLEFLKQKAKDICKVMSDEGIDMVILKNGGIMMDMIEHAVRCPMEDIDSLICKKDFFRAHEILLENGFVFKFRSEYEAEKLDEAYRDGSTEYYILTPTGEKMWFELAWRAVAGRWIRPDLEPDTDMFIENSYCAEGTEVHILSPEDNLLQVCIHTAKHSYVRAPGLRLHLDVERIVTKKEIDWEKFLKKVKDTHVKTAAYFSLYIPSVLFGTEVPEYVLDDLRPKNEQKILNLLADAGLLYPHQRKFNKIQFLRFQTALYDQKSDMWRTLYPGKEWMKERYHFSQGYKIPFYIVIRGLDLAGIRKKK
jgi:hypothetical protein